MELDDLARTLDVAGATLLIDGRSGAGKSTLATRIGMTRPDALIIRLDDIYPGWDGLAWASEHLHREVLAPRAAGSEGRWRAWDWAAGRPDRWHHVSFAQPLVIEGVGALTQANRALADLGVWVETDDDVRRARALARDGETYSPHWRRWAAQEAVHIAEHRPTDCADVIAFTTADGYAFAPLHHDTAGVRS